jgi:ATP-dependent Lon protease
MTSEAPTIDGSLDDLLNRYFPGKIVRKDLTKLVKEGANVPVYVLEYLLGSYCASNDEVVIAAGLQTVKRILAENYVRPDEAEKVKSTVRERGSLKVIDKVTVTLNEKRDVYEALLSNLGVKGSPSLATSSNAMRSFWSAASGASSRWSTSTRRRRRGRRSSCAN